nr:GAP family protein [Mycobacterium sp. GA-1841]
MAIMFAVNPVLLAVIVLMISRPRPVQNLAAYWLGSLIVSLAGLLIPLMVLHIAPAFRSFSENLTTSGKNPTAQLVQFGMGVAMLAVAGVVSVRAVRERSRQPVPAGRTADGTQEAAAPAQMMSPFGTSPDTAPADGSPFRRLVGRLQGAWEGGALWVAFAFGLAGLPPPMLVLFVLTPIATSGYPVGVQILAVILFVIGMFAVVEVTLVSYFLAPARTVAVLRPLHDWALAHRRHMLIAIFSVAGVVQVINGLT